MAGLGEVRSLLRLFFLAWPRGEGQVSPLVRQALRHQLLVRTTRGALAQAFVGVLVAALFSRWPIVGLRAWLGAVMLASLLRVALLHRMKEPLSDRDVRVLRAALALTGVVWAAGIPLFFFQLPGYAKALVPLVSIGMIAGGGNTLDPDPPSFATFAGLLGGPTIWSILASDLPGKYTLGLMIVTMLVLTSSVVAVRYRDEVARLTAQEELSRQAQSLKLLNRELARAREEVERALQARQQFLANMSHEIRTPVGGVLGMVELLLADEEDPERREMLTMARASARSLLDLLGDILEFSRIEAGGIELEEIEFDPLELIEGALATVAPMAGGKGIALGLDLDPLDLPLLRGDSGRLRQVLVNLLGNAVKFTEEGEVVLRVRGREGKGEDGPVYETTFEVIDTGIGIDPARVEAIFEPFRQEEASTRRRFGGTGLGLAISREIARAMGGDIEVESEPGRGSTFRVRVPWSRFAAKQRAFAAREALSGKRVVVADPHPLCGTALAGMLRAMGAETLLLEAPREACEDPPDLAFLDAAYAETPSRHACRCLILVPAGAVPPGLPEGRETLLRPVTPSVLSDRLAPGADEPTGPVRQEEPLAGARILVAEDHPVNRAFLRRILERWGAEVILAEDGREALVTLENHPVDLVLMDISMPGMDGLEATERIRRHPRLSGLPVLALTAHAFEEDRQRCLAAGCDDVVTKPVAPEKLLAAIRAHLPATSRA